MTDPRPKCSYWDTCYRQNPSHLAQFRHPADDLKANGGTAAPPPKPSLKAVAQAATVTTKKANGTSVTKAKEDPPASKKRTRDEEAKPAAASPKPTPATVPKNPSPTVSPKPKPPASPKFAAASSPRAAPSSPRVKPATESTADPTFELKDSDWNDETLALWRSFHSSPDSADVFYARGKALLKALYGGLEFSNDLFCLLAFAAQQHAKMHPNENTNLGDYKQSTSDSAATDESTADVTMSDDSSSSSSSTTPFHTACLSLLHTFAPLLNITLIGPFKILCGFFRHIEPTKLHPYLLDRFFYDSPEVWSVIQQLPSADAAVAASSSSSSSSVAADPAVHYAYFRDDPRPEYPAVFVGRLSETSPAITLIGPNLLSALLAIIDDKIEESGGASSKKKTKLDTNQQTLTSMGAAASSSSSSSSVTLDSLRADLDEFAKSHGYTLTAKGGKRVAPKQDPAWKKRVKQVVCELDNQVGLVVPYEEDIGWRPVNLENHELTKIVSDIEKAKYSGRKVNFDALDAVVTLTQLANDERDPGMGLELALNLMAKSKTNVINSDICRLMSMGYSLVDRNLYTDVIEQHMRHRAKHIRQLPPGRFAKAQKAPKAPSH